MPRPERKRRGRRRGGAPQTATANASDRNKGFLPEVLDRTVIARPLQRQLDDPTQKDALFDIVIDINLDFEHGREAAHTHVQKMIQQLVQRRRTDRRTRRVSPKVESAQYVFASLYAEEIRELVRMDTKAGKAPTTKRAIHHIWPDFQLKRLINKSISTVKADAAHNAFAAFGDDIVWAVIDSGIDGTHPHFRKHDNLDLPEPLKHRDFTAVPERPLVDAFGHGTHVAGIIAGQVTRGRIIATTRHLDERGKPTEVRKSLPAIAGMAPRARAVLSGTRPHRRDACHSIGVNDGYGRNTHESETDQ